MKKRIGYIGLSYPVMYDPDRSVKAWMGGPPLPPHPILDTPYGLIILYDELWFLTKELCPINMRRLSYVKFVDEHFSVDYAAIYDELKGNTQTLPPYREKEIEDIKRGLNIKRNLYYSGFTQNSYVILNGRGYTASPSIKSYSFDILIWRELQHHSKENIELLANVYIPFENILFSGKDIDLTHKLIIKGIPNYLDRHGPYHPCMDEIRESPYLKDFRKWVQENHEHIQNSEIEEMQQIVETEIARIERDAFLKYLESGSLLSFGKSTAVTVFNTAVGATPIGLAYGIGSAAKDIITAGKRVNETKDYRWSGFIEDSRNILSNSEVHNHNKY